MYLPYTYPTKNAYSWIHLDTCGIHVGYMWDTAVAGYSCVESIIQQDTVVESCIQHAYLGKTLRLGALTLALRLTHLWGRLRSFWLLLLSVLL